MCIYPSNISEFALRNDLSLYPVLVLVLIHTVLEMFVGEQQRRTMKSMVQSMVDCSIERLSNRRMVGLHDI